MQKEHKEGEKGGENRKKEKESWKRKRKKEAYRKQEEREEREYRISIGKTTRVTPY